MDIRLKEVPFTIGERDYLLRCNFNVLAEVQESNGGDLLAVINGSTLTSVLKFMAAMLNDYADEQGWPERFTPKQIGRLVGFDQQLIGNVMQLVMGAITPEKNEKN